MGEYMLCWDIGCRGRSVLCDCRGSPVSLVTALVCTTMTMTMSEGFSEEWNFSEPGTFSTRVPEATGSLIVVLGASLLVLDLAWVACTGSEGRLRVARRLGCKGRLFLDSSIYPENR